MLIISFFFTVMSLTIFWLSICLIGTKRGLVTSRANCTFWYESWKKETKNYVGLWDEAMKLRENYSALEQGRDEESEAYEQQFLSFSEILEQQSKTIDFLKETELDHFKWCLPDLLTIDDYVLLANEDEESPIYESVAMDRAG